MKIKVQQKTPNNNVSKKIIYFFAIITYLAFFTSCTASEVETKKDTVGAQIEPVIITKPIGH